MRHTYTLTIAGFDPSCGAGIAADLKTFEALGTYGLGVCTAITYQNHHRFTGLKWTQRAALENQIESLLAEYKIKAAKIGLIKDLVTLKVILSRLKKIRSDVPVVWDPIIEATAGYLFHNDWNLKNISGICADIDFITPNKEEIKKLNPQSTAQDTAIALSDLCYVYVKSWDMDNTSVTDRLYSHGAFTEFKNTILPGRQKHGSGCVFSSALTAYMACGCDVQEACISAGEYVRNFLLSSQDLLGYHLPGAV